MPSTTTPATFFENVFRFGGSAIRVTLKNDNPWFVSHDVCAALGYVNPRKAVADHLDDDERMTVTSSDGHSGKRGGARLMTIINESGLYALVLRSRKPEARKFAKWVTGEVLPSIRKTGGYQVEQKPFSLLNRRYFMFLDENGKEVVKLLTDDHYVLTAEGIAKAIKCGEMSMKEVAAIAEASVGVLFRRCVRDTARRESAADKVKDSLKNFTPVEQFEIANFAYANAHGASFDRMKALGA